MNGWQTPDENELSPTLTKLNSLPLTLLIRCVMKLPHFQSLTGYCETMHNGPTVTGYLRGRQAFEAFYCVRKISPAACFNMKNREL